MQLHAPVAPSGRCATRSWPRTLEKSSQRPVHAYVERHLSQPSTARAESWMDIWAFGALEVNHLLEHVTIRHPAMDRYQPAASEEPAAAASKAAEEKHARYPAIGGRAVTPFVVESCSRLGDEAEQLLERLAAITTRRQQTRGQAPAPGSCLRRWRATLDATLQRGIASALAAARRGLPGRQLPKSRAWAR